jgi:cytochrome c-type biogenesis protein CcmH/NrfG
VAIDQYKTALKMQPSDARALFQLGKDLELYANDYATAADCYKTAHALAPRDQEIAMFQANLQQRLTLRPRDIAWHLRDLIASLCPRS